MWKSSFLVLFLFSACVVIGYSSLSWEVQDATHQQFEKALIETKNIRHVSRQLTDQVTSSKRCSLSGLTSLLGSTLIQASSLQPVPTTELEGKVVGLFISRRSCTTCPDITAKLTSIYTRYQEQGVPFEIIFLSCDFDVLSYYEYVKGMPWLALPYDEEWLQVAKKYVSSGLELPGLRLLDCNGHIISHHGLKLLFSDPDGHSPQWVLDNAEDEAFKKGLTETVCEGSFFTKLLGTELLMTSTSQVISTSTIDSKVVGLFLARSDCEDCREVAYELAEVYNSYKPRASSFEIVFISCDPDVESFNSFSKEMPWLALPYSKNWVNFIEGYISGGLTIPALHVYDCDGEVLTLQGVKQLLLQPSGILSEWGVLEKVQEATQPLAESEPLDDKSEATPVTNLNGEQADVTFEEPVMMEDPTKIEAPVSFEDPATLEDAEQEPASREETAEGETEEEKATSFKELISTPERVANQGLPAGWAAVLDPASGLIYFWDTITNEVTWTRPTAQPQVQHQSLYSQELSDIKSVLSQIGHSGSSQEQDLSAENVLLTWGGQTVSSEPMQELSGSVDDSESFTDKDLSAENVLLTWGGQTVSSEPMQDVPGSVDDSESFTDESKVSNSAAETQVEEKVAGPVDDVELFQEQSLRVEDVSMSWGGNSVTTTPAKDNSGSTDDSEPIQEQSLSVEDVSMSWGGNSVTTTPAKDNSGSTDDSEPIQEQVRAKAWDQSAADMFLPRASSPSVVAVEDAYGSVADESQSVQGQDEPLHEQYMTQIPNGLVPGDTFGVIVGAEMLTLTVPLDKEPGDTIFFELPPLAQDLPELKELMETPSSTPLSFIGNAQDQGPIGKHCSGSFFTQLLGTYLVEASSLQPVPTSAIVGKVIGLYITRQNCAPCLEATKKLSEIYRTYKEQGKPMEIVFLSGDFDVEGYYEAVKDMPWLALPYDDNWLGFVKQVIAGTFELPVLHLFDCDGSLISHQGLKLLLKDPEGTRSEWILENSQMVEPEIDSMNEKPELMKGSDEESAYNNDTQVEMHAAEELIVPVAGKASSKYQCSTNFLAALLGNNLIDIPNGQEVVPTEPAIEDKVVGLYLTNYDCVDCRDTTAALVEIYHTYKSKGRPLEIIFLSCDFDTRGYTNSVTGMPWLSLPFDNFWTSLLGGFQKQCSRLPILHLFDCKGSVITHDGIQLLLGDPEGDEIESLLNYNPNAKAEMEGSEDTEVPTPVQEEPEVHSDQEASEQALMNISDLGNGYTNEEDGDDFYQFKTEQCSNLLQKTYRSYCCGTTDLPVMGGVDLVALFSATPGSLPVPGRRSLSSQMWTTYGTYTFLFSTVENKEMFDKEPWRYVPQYGGFDSCGIAYDNTVLEPGARTKLGPLVNLANWAIQNDRLFFFGGPVSQSNFMITTTSIDVGDAHWKNLFQALGEHPALSGILNTNCFQHQSYQDMIHGVTSEASCDVLIGMSNDRRKKYAPKCGC